MKDDGPMSGNVLKLLKIGKEILYELPTKSIDSDLTIKGSSDRFLTIQRAFGIKRDLVSRIFSTYHFTAGVFHHITYNADWRVKRIWHNLYYDLFHENINIFCVLYRFFIRHKISADPASSHIYRIRPD